jgi:hypothetical protein
MNPSEFSSTLTYGIPVFLAFAAGALVVLVSQANQLGEVDKTAAKKVAIGVASLVVSAFVSIGLGFVAGPLVAVMLLVGGFITIAGTGQVGGAAFGYITGMLLLVLILAGIGIVLAAWPITLLVMRGYKVVKQKPTTGGKLLSAAFAVFGVFCSAVAMLTAAGIMTAVAIQLSGKRFGLS